MALSLKQQQYRESLSGICQLCEEFCESLQLDHDHQTEIARGFVCVDCNRYAIEAGQRKPALVDWKVLEYLDNPPLKDFNWSVKNPRPESPCFGNYHSTAEYWYKEVFDGSYRFASVRTWVDQSRPIEITYYRKNGEQRKQQNMPYWTHSQDELLKYVMFYL